VTRSPGEPTVRRSYDTATAGRPRSSSTWSTAERPIARLYADLVTDIELSELIDSLARHLAPDRPMSPREGSSRRPAIAS